MKKMMNKNLEKIKLNMAVTIIMMKMKAVKIKIPNKESNQKKNFLRLMMRVRNKRKMLIHK